MLKVFQHRWFQLTRNQQNIRWHKNKEYVIIEVLLRWVVGELGWLIEVSGEESELDQDRQTLKEKRIKNTSTKEETPQPHTSRLACQVQSWVTSAVKG